MEECFGTNSCIGFQNTDVLLSIQLYLNSYTQKRVLTSSRNLNRETKTTACAYSLYVCICWVFRFNKLTQREMRNRIKSYSIQMYVYVFMFMCVGAHVAHVDVFFTFFFFAVQLFIQNEEYSLRGLEKNVMNLKYIQYRLYLVYTMAQKYVHLNSNQIHLYILFYILLYFECKYNTINVSSTFNIIRITFSRFSQIDCLYRNKTINVL